MHQTLKIGYRALRLLIVLPVYRYHGRNVYDSHHHVSHKQRFENGRVLRGVGGGGEGEASVFFTINPIFTRSEYIERLKKKRFFLFL